jgi:hypothetical protein
MKVGPSRASVSTSFLARRSCCSTVRRAGLPTTIHRRRSRRNAMMKGDNRPTMTTGRIM